MGDTDETPLTADEIDAAVTQVVEKGLASFIADPERHAFLVDFLHEQGFNKTGITIKALSPLVAKGAEMVAGKIGCEVLSMGKNTLLLVPGVKRVVDKLVDWAPQIDAAWGARVAAGAVIAGRAKEIPAEAFDRLPKELQADVAILLELGEIKKEMALSFEQLIPQLDLYLPTTKEGNRFYYGVQKAMFKGRVAEREDLRRFLDCGRRFAWQLVAGGGGFGKSRLALQFCLDVRDEWEVGFLKEWKEAPFFATWRPLHPTLIVIDYVVGREEGVGKVMEELQLRGEAGTLDQPVRVLLLEREAEGEWKKTFLGTSGAQRVQAGEHAEPIILDTLSDDDLWEVIKTFAGDDPSVDRKEALGRLKTIDSHRRPLYASFLGDDIAHGGKADDKETLLRNALARDQDKFWGAPTDAERDALALATLCGGIEHGRTDLPEGMRPIIDIDFDRYARMSGRPADERFYPLEPDILGELFVLDHLKSKKPSDDRLATMRRLAWETDYGQAMNAFLVRARGDFLHHPTLPLLAAPESVNPAQRALCSAASGILIQGWAFADEWTKGEQFYAELKTVAANHPNEPILREWQAAGATSLMAGYSAKGNSPRVEELYTELKTVADAHPDKPLLREALAMGAYYLAVSFSDADSPVFDKEKGDRYVQDFESLLIYADEFTDGKFKDFCVSNRAKLLTLRRENDG